MPALGNLWGLHEDGHASLVAVSATVSTVLGPLSIKQVPIQQSLIQAGAKGFPDAQVLAFACPAAVESSCGCL